LNRSKGGRRYKQSAACSFGWWLMAGADLQSAACSFGWWLMAGADLF
jgi:hypothetical protein